MDQKVKKMSECQKMDQWSVKITKIGPKSVKKWEIGPKNVKMSETGPKKSQNDRYLKELLIINLLV